MASKSVFISYRRDGGAYIARAVFMELKAHGYDVFMDVEDIDSGEFADVILRQVSARAHFIVILTKDSLDRWDAPDDWFRREFEAAVEHKRNIVPLLVEEFRFEDVESDATAALQKHNALRLLHDYFDAGMEKLRKRFLRDGKMRRVPLDHRYGDQYLLSFNLIAAARFMDVPLDTIRVEPRKVILPAATTPDGTVRDLAIPTNRAGEMWIRFYPVPMKPPHRHNRLNI